MLHGAYLGAHGIINLLINPLMLRAVEVGAIDISRHGVELLTAELTVFLLRQILEVRDICKQRFLLSFLQPSLLGSSIHASILRSLTAGKRGINVNIPLRMRATLISHGEEATPGRRDQPGKSLRWPEEQ
jgi:hypothetical protein